MINEKEKNKLISFNYIISYFVLFLIVISIIMGTLVLTGSAKELKFSFPQKAIFLDKFKSTDNSNFKDLSLKEINNLSEEDLNILRKELNEEEIKNQRYYETQQLLEMILSSASKAELSMYLNKYADSDKIKEILNSFDTFFNLSSYDYKSDINSYEKIFGQTIQVKAVKNIGAYDYTASRYKAIVNRAPLITFKNNVFSLDSKVDKFYDIFIDFNSEMKITNFRFEENFKMQTIRKDFDFFYSLTKENFKYVFSAKHKNTLAVKEILLTDIKEFSVLACTYENKEVRGDISINNEIYTIIIKDSKVIRIFKK